MEASTLSILANKGYVSQEFANEHSSYNKDGLAITVWDDVNSAIYAGVACFIANLSAYQAGDNPNGTISNGWKSLDSWIKERTGSDGNVSSAKMEERRLICAASSFGPGVTDPEIQGPTYNSNHETTSELMYFNGNDYTHSSPNAKSDNGYRYGVAIAKLVTQGRDPYSYAEDGIGPKYLFVP
ncbi:MAG TPA: hypothetical protein PKV16_05535 [Caldisericia bacterium]|nr:hypothetical protein [Caldisericia bacterium]HPF48774.1 hypothetical protein [Caldisericia bacterium]HPI83566.1 hypothetical protein [Caldisericia bacterium]HPQ93229.1 hypothetical protein [Caldisericia bacterium]HRV74938.1 hypothetical protein [Caldisericia bacterium]